MLLFFGFFHRENTKNKVNLWISVQTLKYAVNTLVWDIWNILRHGRGELNCKNGSRNEVWDLHLKKKVREIVNEKYQSY